MAFIRKALFLIPLSMMAVCGGEEPASPDVRPRAAPVIDFSVSRSFSVADFGAVPGDRGSDSALAFEKALAAAVASKEPSAIVFPKGKYYFSGKEERPCAGMVLDGAENIIIDGGGSEFVFLNPKISFLHIFKSRNVIVRNFSADYETAALPFTQGYVKEVNREKGTFVVELLEGFPSLDKDIFTSSSKLEMLRDPLDPRRLKPLAGDIAPVKGWERLADGKFLVTAMDWAKARYSVGDPIIFTMRGSKLRHGYGGYCVHESANVTLKDITSYSANDVHVMLHYCSSPSVVNCKFLIKPGRWLASVADGFHLGQNTPGPWIEGCVIEGTGDDGVTIHTINGQILERKDDRSFLVCRYMHFSPGDKAYAIDPRTQLVLGHAKVESVSPNSEGDNWIVLDKEIKGVVPDPKSFPKGRHPTSFRYSHQLINASANDGFVVRSNAFKFIRRYGLTVLSENGLIEGNSFFAASSHAIMLRPHNEYNESGLPGRIMIKGNIFEDNYFDYTVDRMFFPGGQIRIESCGPSGNDKPWDERPLTEARSISGIAIEGNVFRSYKGTGVFVGSAKDLVISGNTFEKRGKPGSKDDFMCVDLLNAGNVSVCGNKAIGAQGRIFQDSKCEKVEAKDNEGMFLKADPGGR